MSPICQNAVLGGQQTGGTKVQMDMLMSSQNYVFWHSWITLQFLWSCSLYHVPNPFATSFMKILWFIHPSLESESMFSVPCFQDSFHNSCFLSSLSWFSYNLGHVLFRKGLLKFTNPSLQIHKSHKYPDFPLARYFHSHKKSKVWWFTTCLSILSVLLVPYLHK